MWEKENGTWTFKKNLKKGIKKKVSHRYNEMATQTINTFLLYSV